MEIPIMGLIVGKSVVKVNNMGPELKSSRLSAVMIACH